MNNGCDVLVFGASGMIGYTLVTYLDSHLNVVGIVRKPQVFYEKMGINSLNIEYGIDVKCKSKVIEIIKNYRPKYVINAVGVTKRKIDLYPLDEVINVNTLFPLFLDTLAKSHDFRLIQLSTDCVFSGRTGNYDVNDFTDATDVYGKTKALAEIGSSINTLTIRSSYIGHEMLDKTELLEWFLTNLNGICEGFKGSLYSGLTTLQLAKGILYMIEKKTFRGGLLNFSHARSISKFELLTIINDVYNTKKKILAKDSPFVNRVLIPSEDSDNVFGMIPEWQVMLEELKMFNKFFL